MKIAVTSGGLVALLALVFGSAQAVQSMKANIPFQFVVEGKALPAGEYNFIPNDNERSIQVVSVKKGPSAVALVITALANAIQKDLSGGSLLAARATASMATATSADP